MGGLEQARNKWPAVRPDHAAACNRILLELLKAPKGKPFSKIALARRTKVDWHTVERCMDDLLGKRIYGGVISKTTPNGSDLIYVDPIACEALIDNERKAAEEGQLDLARGINRLRAKYCQ